MEVHITRWRAESYEWGKNQNNCVSLSACRPNHPFLSVIISVHHGENHAGLSFGEAMPDAKSAMGAAFGSFLRAVYSACYILPM